MTGAVLKQLRFALGLSIADFADMLHVQPRTLTRWENGQLEVSGSIVPLVQIIANVPEARLYLREMSRR